MHDGNYVQCQNCGHIYYVYDIEDKFSTEDFIIKAECPICNNINGVNCGENLEDIYMFMNINKDPRFYMY